MQFLGKQVTQATQENATQDAPNGQINAAPTFNMKVDLNKVMIIFA